MPQITPTGPLRPILRRTGHTFAIDNLARVFRTHPMLINPIFVSLSPARFFVERLEAIIPETYELFPLGDMIYKDFLDRLNTMARQGEGGTGVRYDMQSIGDML
jgi:hypothetical protein